MAISRWSCFRCALMHNCLSARITLCIVLLQGITLVTPVQQSSSLDGNLRPCSGCARAVMIVAHPDDETFFGGELLLGRIASLPGNCRRICWHVVCVTNGDVPDRRTEFRRALDIAQAHGLSAGITKEMLDYEDCNLPHCENFPGNSAPIREELVRILSGKENAGKWDFVVTHNAQGEYHHVQHVGLHEQVKASMQDARVPGNPRLLVFNPLPEINVTMSLGKKRMVASYQVDAADKPHRSLLLDALTQYAENIVKVEDFARPPLLSLGYFYGAIHQGMQHFSYAWALMSDKDWGEVGAFNAEKGTHFVTDMLSWLQSTSCKAGVVQYPVLCQRVSYALAREEVISSQLRRMEVLALSQADATEGASRGQHINCAACCLEGNARLQEQCNDDACHNYCSQLMGSSIQCLDLVAIGSFGLVTEWEIYGSGSQSALVEFIVARPILVGWKQGYKARTFRILGSSGPQRINSVPSASPQKLHQEQPIAVQPDDVIGWGMYGTAQSSSHSVGSTGHDAAVPTVCRSESSCDEDGLCVFDHPSNDSSSSSNIASRMFSKVNVKLRPRPPTKRGKSPAPYNVRDALNISEYLEATTTYEELLTLRQRLEHPDLHLFEDKIRLRRELLKVVGVAATPGIHLSNDDFEVAKHLEGRAAYVVKPSHMSESQNVFVIRDGINLLRQAWGWPRNACGNSIEEIQSTVHEFVKKTALDWECKALVGVQPGVIVEELVLANDEQSGQLLVDEYKFYVAWGEVVFGEKVPFSSGAALEIDRDGQIITAKVPCPPYCVPSCYKDMVREAEHVARSAKADYLRVDFLIQGWCDAIYVSEVELFPASDFSKHLKDAVARRWLWGYGI